MASPKKRRKPAEDRREIAIRVLVTADEFAAFSAAARSQGMPLSTWLRASAHQILDRRKG